MNCKVCQKESEAYREGRLPEGIRIQVEEHLENCTACAQTYKLETLAYHAMDEEKRMEPNPFLATRIMAGIEELEQKGEALAGIPVFQRLLKPVWVGISVVVAVFIGILAGNLYDPASPVREIPVELTYINDVAIESVDLLSNF